MTAAEALGRPGDGHDGPLAEFDALRQEILVLVQYQQQVLLFQLTLTGAIFSFGLLNPQHVGLILLVPVTSFLLFTRFRSLESAMTLIATYVQEELDPRVPGGLRWERWRLANFSRGRPIADWAIALVITFPGIAVASSVWTYPYAFSAGRSPALVAIWVVGVLLAAYTVVKLVGWRERRWWPSRRGSG